MRSGTGGFGPAVLARCVARRGDILVARCGRLARFCHPIHSDRDSADQQEVVESDTGHVVRRNRASAHTLGRVACGEKCAQCFGTLAVPVSLYLLILIFSKS